MAMFCMPLLVINMGGEMVYILQQRLNAQNVPEEKATKVLQDVVRTMYSTGFLEELFKPQPMYTNENTKAIFDKLAHSSIMKLNKSSMEKLYDLMTMGFKYQVLLCSQPEQLLQVTLNHLAVLRQLVRHSDVVALVASAQQQAERTYGQLTAGQWRLVKEQLLEFFKGRKIKVSLFLKNHIQQQDGTIALSFSGPVPFGSEVPGTIRYFRNDRLVSTQNFDSEVGSVSTEALPSMFEACTLGCNMYLDKAQEQAQAVICSDAAEAASKAMCQYSAHHLESGSAKGTSDYKRARPTKRSGAKATATAEVNLLASLMGSSIREGESGRLQPFKINLFPDDTAPGKDDDDDPVIVINIDGTSDRKDVKAMMKDLKLDESDEEAEGKGCKDEDDDLLALMDSSAK